MKAGQGSWALIWLENTEETWGGQGRPHGPSWAGWNHTQHLDTDCSSWPIRDPGNIWGSSPENTVLFGKNGSLVKFGAFGVFGIFAVFDCLAVFAGFDCFGTCWQFCSLKVRWTYCPRPHIGHQKCHRAFCTKI